MAKNPIKKPNALEVPIASLEEILLLIRYGTNNVAAPIPRSAEIPEKIKLIILAFRLPGRDDSFFVLL